VIPFRRSFKASERGIGIAFDEFLGILKIPSGKPPPPK
jgi:hypothetical protein